MSQEKKVSLDPQVARVGSSLSYGSGQAGRAKSPYLVRVRAQVGSHGSGNYLQHPYL